jgi:hypothetical protein
LERNDATVRMRGDLRYRFGDLDGAPGRTGVKPITLLGQTPLLE